jgi:large conductance mechanosensitive channel
MDQIKHFIDFIRKHGVVGLAIGFIMGGSVSKLVTALVNDLINPFIGLIIGNPEGLKAASFMIGTSTFLYGDFISNLIDFVIIAAVVFFIFKGIGLDKLDKKD